jgi:hypothetical protein
MYHYAAYGLSIQSPLLLPELTPGARSDAGSGTDVTLQFGTVETLPSQIDPAGFGFWATADAACHVLEKVGAFLVRGGREVVIDPAPGVEERLLRLSLLGPVLGLILHQRGFLVLHASVVARGGSAVAFLGKNGWGKSTIAAALHAKGYDLVTDDVAAIRFDEAGPIVLPGFPQVKLWPEAATLLGEAPERLPVLHPNFDKRGWRADRGFSLVPRRLERIYALAAGSSPAIEPLPAREACLGLLGHWYGHRFGGGLLQGEGAALHLQQCATLAAQVPMQRLVRSGGSATLVRLADLVDDDLRAMRASAR